MTCRSVLLGLACTLAFSHAVLAQALPDSWRWARFTTADGLPAAFVTSVVEVPKDGPWAVSRGGIARYDGYRWRPVSVPAGLWNTETFLAAWQDGQAVAVVGGRLLVGGAAGLQLARGSLDAFDGRLLALARADAGPLLLLANDGRLYEWDGQRGRAHDPHLALGRVRQLADAGPTVWASGDGGLASWDGTRWRLRLRAPQISFDLTSVVQDAEGNSWAYIERPADFRGLWHWDAKGEPPTRMSVSSQVVSLGLTRNGMLLAVHSDGEVTGRQNGTWSSVFVGGHRLAGIRSVSVLSSGDVVLPSDDGLFLYRQSDDRWRVHAFPAPDDGNSVNEIAEDPDGSVWLGTAGGVQRLSRDGRLERFPGGSEPPRAVTGIAVDRGGRLWVSSGYEFRGVRWHDAAGWHKWTGDPMLERSYIHRIALDRQGGVWFLGLTYNADISAALPNDGPGAFRLGPDGRLTHWGQAQGLPSGRVYAFQEGPDGAYWFGTLAGLSRWQNGQWRHWTRADGLRTSRVFTLAVDPSGTVWFSHQSNGLGRLAGEQVAYEPQQPGLLADQIWTIRVDRWQRLWVAGQGGVSLYAGGHWTAFSSEALPNARVWPILPTADRLYAGTTSGLAVLKLSEPAPTPVVQIDRPLVESDAAVVRWRAVSWWAETPADAIPTRIRLDEGPWSEWSTAREQRYTSLTPGSHRVQVQAKGLLGTVGLPGLPALIHVRPPFYRSPWFVVPISALSLLVFGLTGLLVVRQRQHHKELHQREALFASIFRASPLPNLLATVDQGRCLDVNPAFERLVAMPREQLLGRTAEEAGVNAEGLNKEVVFSALGEQRAPNGLSARLTTPAGRVLDVLAYLERVEINGANSVLIQFIDVTEQRRLEAQLRQALKMESVGRLAGGVAHDFNNLLTVILGNTTFLEDALAPGDPRREEVEQVRIAAERAERLTRQLLTFARKQVVEPRVVNINDVVLHTDRMLRRLIGEDVELVTLTPDVPPVFIDPGQLEQVLLNMAVNARDAMPEGGKLTVTTSEVVLDQDHPERDPETAPGRYVRLSISDTGVGMDRVTAAHAFDPFFTTKGAGKGTGLGLATCYGIVKQAQGQIQLETTPGHGTTFYVDLPCAPPQAPAGEARERTPDTPGGHETVLLVEDEVQVRRLAAAVLRQRGYDVLQAADGPEALQMAQAFDGRIDLLLTDVVMPRMRGTEVAKAMTAMRPGIRVLYMSGYTDDDTFRQEAGDEAFAFLAKPFTPSGLASRVREVLGPVQS